MAMASCGGDDAAAPGGGGGGGVVLTPDASFVDCWVQGLEYSTPARSGVTEEYGVFEAKLGDPVTFSIGGIDLGTGVAGPFMNPIEVAQATDIFEYVPTNMACLLQTIDDDGDPSNGVVITEAVRTAAAGKTLDFDQRPQDFSSDTNVQKVVSDLTAATTSGTRPLVDYVAARNHLRATLMVALAGKYGGDFRGYRGDDEWEGIWELMVDPNGNMTVTMSPDRGDPVDLTGILQPGGSFTCMDEGTQGLLFIGKIMRGANGLHEVTGSWNDYAPGSGTFDGDREGYPESFVCP